MRSSGNLLSLYDFSNVFLDDVTEVLRVYGESEKHVFHEIHILYLYITCQ